MKDIVVSYSGLRDYRTCRQLHYNRRVLHLKPKRTPTALKRGSWIHELLEALYKGENWEDKLQALTAEFEALLEEEQEYYGDLPGELYRLIVAYEKHWKGKQPKTLAVELSFGEKPTDTHGPVHIGHGVYVKGKIDWICEDHRGVWVGEHKSTKQKIPRDLARLMDLQTAIYTPVAQEFGYDPVGIMFDYLKTRPPTKPRVLVKGGLSKAKNIRTDVATYMEAILENDYDPADYKDILNIIQEGEKTGSKKFFDRSWLPKPSHLIDELLKETILTAREMKMLENYPYRNLRRECDQCSFQNLCTAQLMGHDVKYLLKTEYVVSESEEEGGDFDEAKEEDYESEAAAE